MMSNKNSDINALPKIAPVIYKKLTPFISLLTFNSAHQHATVMPVSHKYLIKLQNFVNIFKFIGDVTRWPVLERATIWNKPNGAENFPQCPAVKPAFFQPYFKDNSTESV